MTAPTPLESLPDTLSGHARWLYAHLETGRAPPPAEIEDRSALDVKSVDGEAEDESSRVIAATVQKMGPASLAAALAPNEHTALLQLKSESGADYCAWILVEDEAPHGLLMLHVAEGDGGSSAQAPEMKIESWDDIEAQLAEHCGGAVQLSMIKDGEIAWSRAWGQADAGKPASAETLFQIASISKSVSAFTIVRMAAAGILDLDEDVNRYLKSFQLKAPGKWQPRITLRLLLRHMAATTVHGFGGYRAGEAVPSATDVLAGKGNSQKVYTVGLPGIGFRYSGGGTTVAQLAAIEASGRSFDDLAQEFTFGPIGMSSSTYGQPLPVQFHDRAAAGHENKAPIEGRWNTYPELAAAGVWTTSSDLARFGLALAAALRGDPGALISQELARDMADPTDGYPVGVGLFCKPGLSFGHNGANRAFFANLCMANDGQTGYTALTNADGAQHTFGPLDTLASEEAGTDLSSPTNASHMALMEAPPEAVSPLTAGRLLGRWKLSFGPEIDIAEAADVVCLTIPGQPSVPIQSVAEDTWQPEGLITRIRIEEGEAGDVLVFSQLGSRFRAQRA